MAKAKVFGMKRYSAENVPPKGTKWMPRREIVKTYFVSAKRLADVWEKLAMHLGETVYTVKKTYGLYYINLSLEQLAKIPWYRCEFVK